MEQQRATLGATELRVHVASHAGDLADLGIRLARQSGSPRKVLDWAERWRSGSLRLRPVRPPDDAELAAALAELRRVSAEAEQELLAGRSAARALARRRTLEERVRRLSRRAAGPLFAPPAEPPTVERLGAALGDAVLVELIATSADGVLSAVTVRDGEPRLHDAGRPGRPAPGAGRAAVRAAPAGAAARLGRRRPGPGRRSGRPDCRTPCSARWPGCSATGRWWWCRPGRCGRCRGRCCRPASAGRSRWRRRPRCGCGRRSGPAGGAAGPGWCWSAARGWRARRRRSTSSPGVPGGGPAGRRRGRRWSRC